MILRLTEAEARSLEGALSRRVSDMMRELVRTEDHLAHAQLKESYEELERLQRRVAELASARSDEA
jgi:polyhydroxyalkanoate synthesis regulator phasin